MKDPIFPLLTVNFIGALGYGVILPFLAIMVIDFGGNEVLYGFIAATYPFFQMIGAPILGSWSDRVGRKRVLFISQLGTLFSWLIFLVAFFTPTTELFELVTERYGSIVLTVPLLIVIIARALDGLTGGNISVANAYLSDISTGVTRKRNFGQLSTSMSLGFIIGPAIAGILAYFPNGNFLTITTATIISLIGLLVIGLYLPSIKAKDVASTCPEESLKRILGSEHQDCYQLKDAEPNTWLNVIKQPNAPFMIALFFLIFLAFNLFYSTFPIYSTLTLEWSAQKLGMFFTLLSAVMIIGQGPLLTLLSRKFQEEELFWMGALIMALTFLCFTGSNNYLIYVAAVTFGLGNGIMWPSYLTMLSKIGSPKMQGTLQGIANSSGSLAAIIGLLIGGFLLSLLAQKVYYLPSIMLLLIFLIGLIYWRTLEKKEHPHEDRPIHL